MVTERAGIACSVEWRSHGMDGLRFEFRQVKDIFLIFKKKSLDWVWGTNSFHFAGYRDYFSVLRLTTHLNIAQRLRMTGSMPLLPLCVFVVWTETSSSFVTVVVICVACACPSFGFAFAGCTERSYVN